MNPKQPDKASHTRNSKPIDVDSDGQQEFEIPDSEESLESHKFMLERLKENILSQDSPPHTSEPAEQERRSDGHPGMPAGKNYFRVREVAALLDVGPHVLRFWESEFSMVRPTKSRSGQRVYRRKDVETLARIRHLLHEQKMSIRAAREVLLKERKERSQQQQPSLKRQNVPAPAKKIHPAAATDDCRPLDLKEILVDLRQLMAFCRKDPFTYTGH